MGESERGFGSEVMRKSKLKKKPKKKTKIIEYDVLIFCTVIVTIF